MIAPFDLALPPPLSGRERRVLELVADGWSAKQIARYIAIAPRTVERHIENIRMKLRARNTPHMVSQAHANGWLKVVFSDGHGVGQPISGLSLPQPSPV